MNEDKKDTKISTGPGKGDVASTMASSSLTPPAVETAPAEQPKEEDAPLAATTTWGDTPTERAITAWVSKRVTGAGGTPLSRNTEVYNYLMKQLPELASMIDEENKA